MKQPLCLGALNSAGSKQQHQQHHWVPEKDPDPTAEVKSGDLYLLTGPPQAPVEQVRGERGSGRRTGGGGKGGRGPSRYPVHVAVYRSSYGHYAVLTAGLRSPATYLNLRTCLCRPCTPSSPTSPSLSPVTPPSPTSLSPTLSSSPTTAITTTTFRVELGGGEGQVVYFQVPPSSSSSSSKDKDGGVGSEVEEWVEAFQGLYGGVAPSPGSISPSLSPLIPRSPIMPTVQESLEEEEDEEEISGLS